jgi:hypothetical protein
VFLWPFTCVAVWCYGVTDACIVCGVVGRGLRCVNGLQGVMQVRLCASIFLPVTLHLWEVLVMREGLYGTWEGRFCLICHDGCCWY